MSRTPDHQCLHRKRGAVMLALAIAVALPFGAGATTVYRCGPEGNVYSQEPCAGGRAVDVGDARTPEQAAHPREQMRRDDALARELRQERVAQEIAFANAQAALVRQLAANDRAVAERARAEQASRQPPLLVVGGLRGVRRPAAPQNFAEPYQRGQLVHPNAVQFGNAPYQVGLNASLNTRPNVAGGLGSTHVAR
jgi:hypothetical protein